jgi:hypothetical protein
VSITFDSDCKSSFADLLLKIARTLVSAKMSATPHLSLNFISCRKRAASAAGAAKEMKNSICNF